MSEELGLLTGWDGASLHFLAVFKAHLISPHFRIRIVGNENGLLKARSVLESTVVCKSGVRTT